MGNQYPGLSRFNAGELSRDLDGQFDLDQYAAGAQDVTNFIPLVKGPLKRRPGTLNVSSTKTKGDRCWQIPFIFSSATSFVLEFGNKYLRFRKNDKTLVRVSGVAAWSSLTTYSIGDLAQSGGVNYYCITAHLNQAPPNATYWYALSGDIYEIPTPYAIADLTASDGTMNFDYQQSGDVMWIAHGSYQERKLFHLGDTRWVLLSNQTTDGPFIGVSLSETRTVYASAATGSGVTLTASASIFGPQHVGTLFLLQQSITDAVQQWELGKTVVAGDERRVGLNVYRTAAGGTTGTVAPTHTEGTRSDGDTGVQWTYVHSGYGTCLITAQAGTTATATVIRELPSQVLTVGHATTRWSFSSWDSSQGYPNTLSFFRHRLCRGRGVELWCSVPDDFDNMAPRDAGLVLDSSAIYRQIAADRANGILWMAEADRLILGTAQGQFSFGEITSSLVLSPSNNQALPQTGHGSRGVNPVQAQSSLIFASLAGRRLYCLEYTIESEAFESTDMSLMADHIAYGGIVQLAYAEEPEKVTYACCADGTLVSMTYCKEQKVLAWAKQPIGGGSLPVEGDNFLQSFGYVDSEMATWGYTVESVVTIPDPGGKNDQLWLQIVQPDTGERNVVVTMPDYDPRERIARPGGRQSNGFRKNAFYVDNGLQFDNTPSSSAPQLTISLGASTDWDHFVTDTYVVTASAALFSASDVGDKIEVCFFENDPTGQMRLTITAFTSTNQVQVKSDRSVPASMRAVALAPGDWAFARRTYQNALFADRHVTVFGDGRALDTVPGDTDGTVHFQKDGQQAWVVKGCIGTPYVSSYRSMRLNPSAGAGSTSQGRTKRPDRLTVRLRDTVGGQIGQTPYENLEAIDYGVENDPLIPMIPPQTREIVCEASGGYTTDGYVYFRQIDPLPVTILAIFPRTETGS